MANKRENGENFRVAESAPRFHPARKHVPMVRDSHGHGYVCSVFLHSRRKVFCTAIGKDGFPVWAGLAMAGH